jgi:outer membrane protein OmpA-like peptidoglycan-associated protein
MTLHRERIKSIQKPSWLKSVSGMIYSKNILFLSSILLLASISSNAQERTDSILVTYQALPLKKKTNSVGRLQFGFVPSENKYVLASNNFDKLPGYFKRLRISEANTSNKISFSRKKAFAYAMPLIDSQVAELRADTLSSTSLAIRTRSLTNYQQNTNRYFQGKTAGTFFKDNWIPLMEFKPTGNNNQLTLQLRKGFSKKAEYRTAKLPIGFAPKLPAIDEPKCEPMDRFYRLRKMNGYGLNKFKYQTYQAKKRQIVRQEFEVYFDKNSSDSRQEDVQRVIDYLKNNDYSILNASVEGYSSLEGNEERNNKLQIKRANVLINVLQRYNNQPIKLDTVIVSPAHKQFRENIRSTSYSWLASLNSDSIRVLLNTDDKLLESVEPYLTSQRKAVLKLSMSKRLSSDELFQQFKLDFTQWEARLNPKALGNRKPHEVEARVMGMIDYLFSLLETGTITAEQFAEVIEQAKSYGVLRVLIVYHKLIEFEKEVRGDSLQSIAYFRINKFSKLLDVGHNNLVALIQDKEYKLYQDKFKLQLVDMQSYLFEFVRKGWLPVSSLCAIDYPQNFLFWGYILNKLAFLQYLTKYMDVSCESMKAEPWQGIKKYSDSWLDEVKADKQTSGIAYAPTAKYAPSYGMPSTSPYLYYLKTLYIKKKGSVAPYITFSDDFREFDLFTLANYHVTQWDPFMNYYTDPEVQIKEIDKVIKQLKARQRLICSRDVNELYLEYHLKALHYMSVYYEPGNAEHTTIVQQSLLFTGTYYVKFAGLITPRLSSYILHQLNAFHWMPGRYDGTWYARNVLKSIKSKRELTTDEIFLYDRYLIFYP